MELGRILIYLGILLLAGGVIIIFFPNIFSWIGNLPGDIRITRGQSKLFIPITSMILISLLLTLIINVVLWIIRILSK
jgi:hypothetical protein